MEIRRVVVTGLGAVTPIGIGIENTWQALLAGKSGARRITRFDPSDYPTQFVAEVVDFDPTQYMDFREAKRTARFTQFGLVAAQEAVRHAALDLASEDMTRVGIQLGTAIGGIDVVQELTLTFHEQGLRRVNPTVVPVLIPSAGACHVAIALGIKGPTSCPVAACATGIVAVGDALRLLQRGDVDVVFAGGTEGSLSPLDVAAFSRLGTLSTYNDEPTRACRPFDATRNGTLMAEGAAVLVLETLEHAQHRNAPILGEVLGYALTEDAYHIAAPDPSGDGPARSMALAIADSGLRPQDIDYIVPHGTGTTLNDISETRAIKTVFGPHAYRIPISSNKSMLGHMLGAAGAISTAVAILAIRDQIIPPTINLENPDPECDLDYVPGHARKATLRTAMANAFGFGGQNASVVVRGMADN